MSALLTKLNVMHGEKPRGFSLCSLKISTLGLTAFLLIGTSFLSFANHYEMLLLNGNSDAKLHEAALVRGKTKLGGHTFAITEVDIATGGFRMILGSVNLKDEIGSNIILSDFQIVWLTWNCPGYAWRYQMEGVEEDFLNWVKAGGYLYMSAFDDGFTDADGNQIGKWMPIDEFPVTVDDTGANTNVKITEEGKKSIIFSEPNKISENDLSDMVWDDNLHPENPDDWVIFATREDNGQPAVCYLPYHNGGYVEACLGSESNLNSYPTCAKMKGDAVPLVENVLYFMAEEISSEAVKPTGRLTTTWGNLKSKVW